MFACLGYAGARFRRFRHAFVRRIPRVHRAGRVWFRSRTFRQRARRRARTQRREHPRSDTGTRLAATCRAPREPEVVAHDGGLQAPGAGAKITFTEVHVGTDRVLHTTAMGEFGSFTMGSTPTLSWSTDPALGITIRELDEQLGVVRWFAFNRRAPWRTLYAEAELVGVEDVDGDDCWKLRMNPKAGTDATWYVDQATHLPRKIDVKVPNPTGGDVAMSRLFEDWKDVDGIPFPYVKKMAVMGVEMVYRYTSIELDVDVAPAEIDPPADVQAVIDDPKLRSRIAPEKGGDVTIESVEPLVVASVRATVKADEISRQLARMLPEVGGAVAQSGAEMTGPPFTRYHGGLDTPELDIEAGIPVKRRVETKGRAVLSELPGWQGRDDVAHRAVRRIAEDVRVANLDERARGRVRGRSVGDLLDRSRPRTRSAEVAHADPVADQGRAGEARFLIEDPLTRTGR